VVGARDAESQFVGQAQHHPQAAFGSDSIRESVGAIALARDKVYSSTHDLFAD